ncbi:endolytic transglycosylase MltG [Pseudofrankia sp. DC12]|uniref:endolytic transglycosylase MltG n=1 Tax=Pseudofrankia sp. DC12 TaxID=683315 RepID=UPI0006971AC7|nr:endolytic transglycosylase MltG [Pseudofrankia sp. DC12]
MSEHWDLDNGVGGTAGYGNDPWAAHRTGARPVDPFAVGSPDDGADISVGGGPVPGGSPGGPTGAYPAAGGGYGADAFTVGDQSYAASGYPPAASPTAGSGPGYRDTTAAFFGAGTGAWPSDQAPEAPSGYDIPGPAVGAPYVGGPYLGDAAASGADGSAVAYTETSTGHHAALGYTDGGPGPAAPGYGASQAGYQQAGYPTGYLEPVQTGYLEPVGQTGYLEPVPQTGYQEAVHPTGYQDAAQQTGYQQGVGYPEAFGQQTQAGAYDYQTGRPQTGVNPSTGTFSTGGYQQAVPAVEQSGYQPAVEQSGYQQVVPAIEQTGGYGQAAALDQQAGYQAGYSSGAPAVTGGHAVMGGYATEQYLADPYPRTGGLARPALPAQPTAPGQDPSYAAAVPAGYPEASYPAAVDPAGYDASGQAGAFGTAAAFGTAGSATGVEAYPAADYPQGSGGYQAATARYSDGLRPAGTGPRRQADPPGPAAVSPPAAPPSEGTPRPARRGRRPTDRRTEALNFRIDPPEDLYGPADEDYADEPRGRFEQAPAAGQRRSRAGARSQNGRFAGEQDHLDSGLDDLDDGAQDPPKGAGPRFDRPRRDEHSERVQRRRRAAPKLVAMLLVLAVLLGGGIYAGGKMLGRMTGSKAIPDYPGPGSGSADVKVAQGATATDIAGALFAADVVKSRQSFITAAANDPNSRKIQPGTYRLKKQMTAVGALAALLDSGNSIYRFILAPGKTADFLITELSQRLGVPKQTYQDLLDHPDGKLDLPTYAHGRVEGYLLPSTYDLDPTATPAQTLNLFIDAFKAQAAKINLEAVAQQDGMTPDQIVTVASIIQMEVPRIDDGQKVARVIYNRLNDKTGKYQKLDMDSTTRYAVQKPTGALTQSDLNNPSPFNTRLHTGLPPGAIASPALWALTSALHPYTGPQGSDGQPWYYFVALPKSNVTIYASESEWPAAHARFVAEGGVG